MNKEIEELKVKFNKVLENYELDKKFGQLSLESIYHLFPTEIETLLNYINGLEERIEYLERSNDRREETIIELRNEVGGYDK